MWYIIEYFHPWWDSNTPPHVVFASRSWWRVRLYYAWYGPAWWEPGPRSFFTWKIEHRDH